MSKHPDDNTAAAKTPWVWMCFPLLYFPPFYAWEILVMSFYDITIVCSIILAGKPLCMHTWTCQWSSAYPPASTPINCLYRMEPYVQNVIVSFPYPFSCLWYIYPIMHFGGIDLPVDLLIWNLKLPFLATDYLYIGGQICYLTCQCEL